MNSEEPATPAESREIEGDEERLSAGKLEFADTRSAARSAAADVVRALLRPHWKRRCSPLHREVLGYLALHARRSRMARGAANGEGQFGYLPQILGALLADADADADAEHRGSKSSADSCNLVVVRTGTGAGDSQRISEGALQRVPLGSSIDGQRIAACRLSE